MSEIRALENAIEQERAQSLRLAAQLSNADEGITGLHSKLSKPITTPRPSVSSAATPEQSQRLETLQMRRIMSEQGLQLKMSLASAEAGRKSLHEVEQLLHEREEDIEYIVLECKRRSEAYEARLRDKDCDIEKLIGEIKLLEAVKVENEHVIDLMRTVVDGKNDCIGLMQMKCGLGVGRVWTENDAAELESAYRQINEMAVERDVLMAEVDRRDQQQHSVSSHRVERALVITAEDSEEHRRLQEQVANLTTELENATHTMALRKLESDTAMSILRKQSETSVLQCQQKYTGEIERVMDTVEGLHREKVALDDAVRAARDQAKRDVERAVAERKVAEERLAEETRRVRGLDSEGTQRANAMADDLAAKTEKVNALKQEVQSAGVERDRCVHALARSRAEEEGLRTALLDAELSQQQMIKDNSDLADRIRQQDREVQRQRAAAKVTEEEKAALRAELDRVTAVGGDIARVQDTLQSQHRHREADARLRQADLMRVRSELAALEGTTASLQAECEKQKLRAEDSEASRASADVAAAAVTKAYEELRARSQLAAKEFNEALAIEREKWREKTREVVAVEAPLSTPRDRAGADAQKLQAEIILLKERNNATERSATLLRGRLLDLLSQPELRVTSDDVALHSLSTQDLVTELTHRVSELESQLASYIQFGEGIRNERNTLATLVLDDADIADLGSDASAADNDDDDDGEGGPIQEEQRRWVRVKLHLHGMIRSLKSKRKEVTRLRTALSDSRRATKDVQETLLEKDHQLELRADTRVRFLVEQRPHMLRELVTSYESHVGCQKICRGMQTSMKTIRTASPGTTGLEGLSQDVTNLLRGVETSVGKLQGVISNCFTDGEKTSAGISSSLFSPETSGGGKTPRDGATPRGESEGHLSARSRKSRDST